MPGQIGSLSEAVEKRPLVNGWELLREDQLADSGQPPTILAIDSQEINRRLLRGILKQAGYRLLETARPTEAFEILERAKVDLVVADLVMDGISGLDFCRRMKDNRPTRLIPVLIITSIQGVETEVAGLASGADDFLTRPLHASLVRTRIASLLRQKAAVDSLEEAESILCVLGQAVEQRDEAISGHCKRLDRMCMALGAAAGVSRPQLLALHRGAFLHDIGKVSVPDSILFKPGPLTKQEWDIMHLHPIKGEEICRPVKSLASVLPIIRSHHERWDGSGYPDGLAGEEVPLLARILQMADIYDALTSPRPYKPALPGPEAVEILEPETSRGWRDPALYGLFRELWETSIYPGVQPAPAARIPLRSVRPEPVQVPAAALK
jgi:putative two-component system response regulator